MKKVCETTCKIFVCCALLLSSFSCKHETVSVVDRSNRLIPIETDEKTAGGYVIFVNMGHDAKGCPGCIQFYGKWVHVDCQGHGTACSASAAVALEHIGTDITAMTTDTFGLTSEDFFLMPNRSLEYVDENRGPLFLNIPSQLVFRDSVSQQFTFTGLYFSGTAAYSND